MNVTSLLSGTGPLHSLLIGLALGGMVLAILIWVMEFAGWTISRRGFVRSQVSWDATTIAIIAVVAAIYIAGRPIQIQFIPGIGGINPSMSLAPVFAVLFGLPGAIGVTFSMPIGDAVSGALTVGSAAGFLSHTFITWLPYKLVREPNFKIRAAVVSFFVWAIVIGPAIHTVVIPGWLDFTNGLPKRCSLGGAADRTPAQPHDHACDHRSDSDRDPLSRREGARFVLARPRSVRRHGHQCRAIIRVRFGYSFRH